MGQDVHNKSQLDNIVGSLWQARQESSGSSLGNQVGDCRGVRFGIVAAIGCRTGAKVVESRIGVVSKTIISNIYNGEMISSQCSTTYRRIS